MLEAFQSLRAEFTSQTSKQPQVGVDQTSALTSKPGLSSQAAIIGPTPPRPTRTTSQPVEDMEVEYGPALPPGHGADHDNASDQHSGLSDEPMSVPRCH